MKNSRLVPAELAAEFKAATRKQVRDVPDRKAMTPYAHAEMSMQFGLEGIGGDA